MRSQILNPATFWTSFSDNSDRAAAALAIRSTRLSEPFGRCALAISVGLLLWCLVLNSHEIWAVVRFGKVLVLPLTWVLSGLDMPLIRQRRLWAPVLGACVISQFVYAFYSVYWVATR